MSLKGRSSLSLTGSWTRHNTSLTCAPTRSMGWWSTWDTCDVRRGGREGERRERERGKGREGEGEGGGRQVGEEREG